MFLGVFMYQSGVYFNNGRSQILGIFYYNEGIQNFTRRYLLETDKT